MATFGSFVGCSARAVGQFDTVNRIAAQGASCVASPLQHYAAIRQAAPFSTLRFVGLSWFAECALCL